MRESATKARTVEVQSVPLSPESVTVVIPTLNESERLPGAVASALAPGVEVVVVDGGSTDDTVAVARVLGVRVIHAVRGRGSQLVAGARVAAGELLVFLHADARLPAGYATEVRRTLADRGTALGAFRLHIDSPGLRFRAVEWGVRQRCRWLRMPYGDQALFLRADTYERMGGFRSWSVMEDFDLVRRARRFGAVRTREADVRVSPRAWLRHGVLRFTLVNFASSVAGALGVGPERIARWRGRALGLAHRSCDSVSRVHHDP